MLIKNSHISVCICTYKRPKLLGPLLKKLEHQNTNGLFKYSIIVVDNDDNLSAKRTVTRIKKTSSITIDYYTEPDRNIACARNKALQNAHGNFVAFIDDDEHPLDDWLYNLFKTCHHYKADGVLGPVKPRYEKKPPQWIIRAKLFERPSHKTGLILHWNNTRTGNVLFKKNILNENEDTFNPKFRHGEDKDFFRRMIQKGYIFVWCDEAPVFETQLPDRFKRTYFLRRALLRGSVSLRHLSFNPLFILKSMVAFQLYTLALPCLFVIGHHIFMKYLIKDCDHIGRLMAACGLDVERYLLK